MDSTVEVLRKLTEYKELYEACADGRTTAVFGVDVHKAYFSALLCKDLDRPAFIIVPDEAAARTVCEIMNAQVGKSYIFPAKDYAFRDIESVSRFDENRRIEIISLIRKNNYNAVIIPADALCATVMPPESYTEFELTTDSSANLSDLSARLTQMGYEFFSAVEGPGQFSVRGGILDIFPPGEDAPYRIEFFGDDVDSISLFDINTQRRTEIKDKVTVTPAKEFSAVLCKKLLGILEPIADRPHIAKDVEMLKMGVLPKHDRYLPACYERKAGILDYAPDNALFFIFNLRDIKERLDGFIFRLESDIKSLAEDGYTFLKDDYYFTSEQIFASIKSPVIFETLPCSVNEFPPQKIIDIALYPANVSTPAMLKDSVLELLESGYNVTVLASDARHAAELIHDYPNTLGLTITQGALPYGFNAPSIRTAVFSFKNIRTENAKKRRARKYERGERIKSFSDIHEGDYVVHSDYGIGVYDGIHKVTQNNITKDFIKIKYLGTDVLYIPCEQLDRISKYIGGDTEVKVKLNKLGGTDWTKTKQRVKKAVRDLAKNLIELYGQRAKVKGHCFSPDTEWQHNFEASFEFEETEDQLRCIDEIKADMESSKPMDRLLCGDVGFGKTEVALRAVFKCVNDSMQAAILAPTTILAFQHYNTILRRFDGYPVKIELLSRMRTPKQQEEILRKLKRGEIDVLIGTHRLIQKDVVFKNLGLLVIDEEQRFGVAHKEKLKEATKSVDVLTLSATPIPRTLNMSLAGIRDISILNEPPHNRYPVTTYVAEYDIGIISDAIKREVARGGQCFYLHNRIETIYKTAALINEKTGVRVAVAHGKMSHEELSGIWESLVAGDIDVLVCTTIIETGVDVPNCNTLIIEDADKLGLAQLHQIRGRVGRTDRRAFAYFMFKRGKTLSADAYKRLMTIREYTEFGSGLKIAMRDLEIRGAGDILGAEQSGHLVTVGFDMYMKLLETAVSEEKGEIPTNAECLVDVKVNAYIPDSFIRDSETRIEIYKMIAGISTDEDYSDVLDEIIDRFGDPPHQIIDLMKISILRTRSAAAGFSEVRQVNTNLLFFPSSAPELRTLAPLNAKYGRKVLFSAGTKPYFTLKTDGDPVAQGTDFATEYRKLLDDISAHDTL